ncbi:MAG: GntR family transcriptional regulator [Firmicutes bacterium]|nr:GntR family transcriptional regulator [Bacillota bacterium]
MGSGPALVPLTQGKRDSKPALDRDVAVPLHEQLKIALRHAVDAGRYSVGTRIPSERELCEMFGVSRITVRLAISEGVQEGWLQRYQGKGTYVAERRITQGLGRIRAFGSTMESAGLKPSTRFLGANVVPADILIGETLHLSQPAVALNIRVVGFGNGEPMVFYDSYFDIDRGSRIAEECRRRTEAGQPFSTFDLYQGSTDPHPSRVDQTFEAQAARATVAQALGIPEGSPVFLITSIFYTAGGAPLEFRRAYYRGDRYRFTLSRDIG